MKHILSIVFLTYIAAVHSASETREYFRDIAVINGRTYEIDFNAKLDFTAAMSFCESLGMTIAALEDPVEWDSVTRYMIDNRYPQNYWVNVQKLTNPENYFWIYENQQTVVDPITWCEYQPNGFEAGYLGLNLNNSNVGCLLDGAFAEPHYILCEEASN